MAGSAGCIHLYGFTWLELVRVAARFDWKPDDPEIVSDVLFAVANVLSIARTTYLMHRTTYLMPAFEVLRARMWCDVIPAFEVLRPRIPDVMTGVRGAQSTYVV